MQDLPKKSPHLVFISYRRDDSSHATGRIYDRLIAEFGTDSVFKDVDSIPIAADFRSFIRKTIKKCDVFIAVVGHSWANLADEQGKPRLHEPQDLVRLEIEAALELEIPVIPLLLDDVSLNENDLPKGIKELSYSNGLPIRRDPDFHKDVTKLIAELKVFFESTTRVTRDIHELQFIR